VLLEGLGGASEILEELQSSWRRGLEKLQIELLEGLQSYWRSSEGSEPWRSLMGFRALGGAWRSFRDLGEALEPLEGL
jgi:hypothetical protein